MSIKCTKPCQQLQHLRGTALYLTCCQPGVLILATTSCQEYWNSDMLEMVTWQVRGTGNLGHIINHTWITNFKNFEPGSARSRATCYHRPRGMFGIFIKKILGRFEKWTVRNLNRESFNTSEFFKHLVILFHYVKSD